MSWVPLLERHCRGRLLALLAGVLSLGRGARAAGHTDSACVRGDRRFLGCAPAG